MVLMSSLGIFTILTQRKSRIRWIIPRSPAFRTFGRWRVQSYSECQDPRNTGRADEERMERGEEFLGVALDFIEAAKHKRAGNPFLRLVQSARA